jgi:leucyl aminopeptidase
MKLTTLSVLALSASAINARFVEKHETDQVVLNSNGGEDSEQYLIELSPGETRLVTEEDKWDLKRVMLLSFYVMHSLTVPSKTSTLWTSRTPNPSARTTSTPARSVCSQKHLCTKARLSRS